MTKKRATLLWLDLEMTGLDPTEDRILEVGAIATDWDFNEIATLASAVKVDGEIIGERMRGEFWKKFAKVRKKLVEQNNEAELTSEEVEKLILKFILENFDSSQPVYLAGNSVYKDREFIKNEWAVLDDMLHYRMLDVSAWKIVFANKFGIEVKKPDRHRAVEDIKGSIEELRVYVDIVSKGMKVKQEDKK
ncbi:oligoribonuclease [Candidatus Saccharibacteria bacterium]|nr:oligoribonuclease [Candidatus Saccharibacteria bacterium]